MKYSTGLMRAAVLGLAFATSARADFTVTAVRTDLGGTNSITTNGNGTITGAFGMIRFYAENQGAAGAVSNQGTKLSTVAITMSDTGAGNLVIGGYNQASGTPAPSATADLFGQHEVSVSGSSYIYKQTLTTTTGAPKYVSFFNVLGDATVAGDNNANQTLNIVSTTPANAYSNYGYGIKSFGAIYATTNAAFGVDATTANGGLGALFAVAVVPIADSVNVQGQFGGNIGNATNFNYTSTVLPGDANLDGSVNSTDLQILLNHFNTTGNTWSTGDFNGDGATNSTDLQSLLNNFNHSSPPAALPSAEAALAVPEPATIALILPLSVLALKRKRS